MDGTFVGEGRDFKTIKGFLNPLLSFIFLFSFTLTVYVFSPGRRLWFFSLGLRQPSPSLSSKPNIQTLAERRHNEPGGRQNWSPSVTAGEDGVLALGHWLPKDQSDLLVLKVCARHNLLFGSIRLPICLLHETFSILLWCTNTTTRMQ